MDRWSRRLCCSDVSNHPTPPIRNRRPINEGSKGSIFVSFKRTFRAAKISLTYFLLNAPGTLPRDGNHCCCCACETGRLKWRATVENETDLARSQSEFNPSGPRRPSPEDYSPDRQINSNKTAMRRQAAFALRLRL